MMYGNWVRSGPAWLGPALLGVILSLGARSRRYHSPCGKLREIYASYGQSSIELSFFTMCRARRATHNNNNNRSEIESNTVLTHCCCHQSGHDVAPSPRQRRATHDAVIISRLSSTDKVRPSVGRRPKKLDIGTLPIPQIRRDTSKTWHGERERRRRRRWWAHASICRSPLSSRAHRIA